MVDQARLAADNRVYTLPQIADVSEIDYRTLHNWQKRGMLSASHRAANGSGTANLFDATDALQILILAELRRSGVEVRVLEAVAAQIWELAKTMSAGHVLLISANSAVLSSDAELGERLRGNGPSHVLSVGPMLATLCELPPAA